MDTKHETIEKSAENQGNQADAPADEPTALDLVAETLLGDFRDRMLKLFREQAEPWRKLSENGQIYLAQYVEDECRRVIVRAVGLLAARGFEAIPVGLETVAFKPKGIEAKLTLAGLTRDVRHALVDAQGHPVMIVIADHRAFMGARGAPQIDRQALVDAPPVGEDGEGDAVGPLPEDPGDEPVDAGPRIIKVEDLPHQADDPSGGAKKYFRDMGRDSALGGGAEDDNPFPSKMPAHKSWAAGWKAGRESAEKLAAADAAAALANGEVTQP